MFHKDGFKDIPIGLFRRYELEMFFGLSFSLIIKKFVFCNRIDL